MKSFKKVKILTASLADRLSKATFNHLSFFFGNFLHDNNPLKDGLLCIVCRLHVAFNLPQWQLFAALFGFTGTHFQSSFLPLFLAVLLVKWDSNLKACVIKSDRNPEPREQSTPYEHNSTCTKKVHLPTKQLVSTSKKLLNSDARSLKFPY